MSAIGHRLAHRWAISRQRRWPSLPDRRRRAGVVRNAQSFDVRSAAGGIASRDDGPYRPVLDTGSGWKLRLGAGPAAGSDPSVLFLDTQLSPGVDLVVETDALPFVDGSVVYFEATEGL